MRNAAEAATPPEERGIALILVLLVLILTSILAIEIRSSAALHMRLATNQRDDLLVRVRMRGQVNILKEVLLLDLQEGDVDALDDRWTDEKYTRSAPEGKEDRDEGEPVSSEGISLTVRIEDEARKFNLHNLVVEDEALRAHWEEVFVRLVDLYREETEHDQTAADGRNLLENLKKWLARRDDPSGIPRPAPLSEKRVLITPDELLMVEGFTREIFFDREPEDEDEGAPPGLYRYLTLWSDGPVNLNTAEPAMVYALFSDADQAAAESFLEWREQDAEEQPEHQDPDAEPKKNAIRGPQDLLKVDGFTPEILQANRIGPATVTVRSPQFSIHLFGKSSKGVARQERWVIQRNPIGFTTILFEERNDPIFDSEDEEE